MKNQILPQSKQIQEHKQIPPELQMNICTLQLQGAFVSAYNNSIYIFDCNYNILYRSQVDFDYSQNKLNKNNKIEIGLANNYQAQLVNGKHYIKYYDKILQLLGDKLIFISKIPNCSLLKNHNKLFVHNEQLYVSNGFEHVYLLENNQLKRINYFQGNNFISWCGNTIKLIPHHQIIVLKDKQEQFLQIIDSDISLFSFCHGGVVCFQNQSGTNFLLIDLITFKSLRSTNIQFKYENIQNQIILTRYGLSLPDSMLINVFGERFLYQRNLHQMNYFKMQQQQISACREQLSKLNCIIQQKRKELANDQQNTVTNNKNWKHLYKQFTVEDAVH